MKRIKTRKKHFRISNPLGFSLFCAMIILAVGLIFGVVFLIRGGYFREALSCVKTELINDKTTPTAEPEAQATDAPTPTPVMTPADTASETPEIGTPAPETPTPPPIEPETPDPSGSAHPTVDPNAPLAGFTIGIDPTRDGGSKYKSEGEFNLEFAQKLGEYLESKGATVVITRDNNKKSVGNDTRAKTIKNGGCDIAFRLMCNHIAAKTSGCYVQCTKGNKSYGQALIAAYSEKTGIKMQNGKKDGIEVKSDAVASKCGCPCVLLVMGNWDNKSERANMQDDATQQKMMQAIYETLLSQLKK